MTATEVPAPAAPAAARRTAALSPSRAGDFMSCPLLYRFRVLDRLPERPSAAAARGTLVHAVLDRLFDLPAAHRTLDEATRLVEPEWQRLLAAEPELAALCAAEPAPEAGAGGDSGAEGSANPSGWLSGAAELLERYFRLEDPRLLEPAARELLVETVLDSGLTLRGYVDRLDQSPTGELRLVDYKGLAHDTPLPTPAGWTTMGEVREGDSLIGANGVPCRVIGKSQVHHRPCYEVAFTDGSRVICDNVHLWSVHIAGSGDAYTEKVMNTDELAHHIVTRLMTCRGRRRPFIHAAAPVELPEADLPISPWVLGAWLGDGARRSGEITVGREDQDDMLRLLKEHWAGGVAVEPSSESGRALAVHLRRPRPDLCPHGHDSYRVYGREGAAARRRCAQERSHRPEGRWNSSLSDLLTRQGLRYNKHVPGVYLRGSRQQRLALLQGLMDTDGSWSGQHQRAVFVTTTPALAHGVRELVHSLGATSTLFTKDYTVKRGARVVHMVAFRPYGFNPFLLPRKAAKVHSWFARSVPPKMGGVPRELRRTIASVTPVESVPTQCVMVDAPDSLYLCGDTFIPTHNTGRAPRESFEARALFQLRFYALVLWRVRGRVPRVLQLLYLGSGEVLRYEPDEADLRATERKLAALWLAIIRATETGDWRPSPSKLCTWCDHQKLCPAFGGTPPPLPGHADPAAVTFEAPSPRSRPDEV